MEVTVGAPPGEITFTVTDRGVGLPEGELTSFGQRFFRGSNVTTVQGSGLGLHIVSLIMDKHGGRLEVANRAGRGARIALSLPAIGHGSGGPTIPISAPMVRPPSLSS